MTLLFDSNIICWYNGIIFFTEMRFGAVIKSMTGFGKAEELTHEYKIAVEIRSVNHRYFDLSIKMPKRFSKFERRSIYNRRRRNI